MQSLGIYFANLTLTSKGLPKTFAANMWLPQKKDLNIKRFTLRFDSPRPLLKSERNHCLSHPLCACQEVLSGKKFCTWEFPRQHKTILSHTEFTMFLHRDELRKNLCAYSSSQAFYTLWRMADPRAEECRWTVSSAKADGQSQRPRSICIDMFLKSHFLYLSTQCLELTARGVLIIAPVA